MRQQRPLNLNFDGALFNRSEVSLTRAQQPQNMTSDQQPSQIMNVMTTSVPLSDVVKNIQ